MLSYIREFCSDFLKSSEGYPLIKQLPNNYGDEKIVKVRKRKSTSKYDLVFNQSFDDVFPGIRQRSIFIRCTYPNKSEHSLYYVFPLNGFRYLYNAEVQNSSEAFEHTFDILHQRHDIKKLMNMSYKSNNLAYGIKIKAEIILYNSPSYIAIRTDTTPSYHQLLNNINLTYDN